MGTYGVICCHAQCEVIRPECVDNCANKIQHIAYNGSVGRLVLHLMSYTYTITGNGTWTGVEIVTENHPMWETASEHYLDVTKAAIDSYNDQYPDAERLIYTPKSYSPKPSIP